jgi:hypothetical protein
MTSLSFSPSPSLSLSISLQIKRDEDFLYLMENNLDDINNRYDWAIDRLKYYVEKEKKKGNVEKARSACEALSTKCGGMEERRYEMVAEIFHHYQERHHQVGQERGRGREREKERESSLSTIFVTFFLSGSSVFL